MISRYNKEEISSIWSDDTKFQLFLKVELAAMLAQEGEKLPIGISDQIAKQVKINKKRIDEIEAEVKHDLIAFCSSITEQLPPELGRFFHFGVTSSDIIDTALTLQIKSSLEKIIPYLKSLLQSLHKKAEETKKIITIGRSHGMYAEPFSFRQKWLGFYAEFYRRLIDIENFYNNDLTAQFSGAVGNYTVISPDIEKRAAQYLDLKVEPLSTQVIPRDRIAKLININALIASAIERLAIEIRHLHRSEVNEVEEGFTKGQKGSSIMPHKKNPIASENLSGIARILRSHTTIAMENIPLWHERDISHSSAERLYLPDNFGLTFYSLERMKNVIDNLKIDQEKIEERVFTETTYLSSYILHFILEKTNLSREKIYKIVQTASFNTNTSNEFYQKIESALKQDNILLSLPMPDSKEIKRIYHAHIDQIYEKVEAEYPVVRCYKH